MSNYLFCCSIYNNQFNSNPNKAVYYNGLNNRNILHSNIALLFHSHLVFGLLIPLMQFKWKGIQNNLEDLIVLNFLFPYCFYPVET